MTRSVHLFILVVLILAHATLSACASRTTGPDPGVVAAIKAKYPQYTYFCNVKFEQPMALVSSSPITYLLSLMRNALIQAFEFKPTLNVHLQLNAVIDPDLSDLDDEYLHAATIRFQSMMVVKFIDVVDAIFGAESLAPLTRDHFLAFLIKVPILKSAFLLSNLCPLDGKELIPGVQAVMATVSAIVLRYRLNEAPAPTVNLSASPFPASLLPALIERDESQILATLELALSGAALSPLDPVTVNKADLFDAKAALLVNALLTSPFKPTSQLMRRGKISVYEATYDAVHYALKLNAGKSNDAEFFVSSLLLPHSANFRSTLYDQVIDPYEDLKTKLDLTFMNQPRLTVYPYMDCTLATMLKDGSLAEYDRPSILLDLFQAVAEMHDRNLVHRDFKPANILVDKHVALSLARGSFCRSLTLKLADFGSSELLPYSPSLMHVFAKPKDKIVGTPRYMPPEMILESTLALDPYKADAWALGMLILDLYGVSESLKVQVAETLPQYYDRLGRELLYCNSDSYRGLPFVTDTPPCITALANIDAGAAGLASRLLVWDPFLRSSVYQALKDPFFAAALALKKTHLKTRHGYRPVPVYGPVINALSLAKAVMAKDGAVDEKSDFRLTKGQRFYIVSASIVSVIGLLWLVMKLLRRLGASVTGHTSGTMEPGSPSKTNDTMSLTTESILPPHTSHVSSAPPPMNGTSGTGAGSPVKSDACSLHGLSLLLCAMLVALF